MGMFFFEDGLGATFEITRKCNLKCQYCYIDSKKSGVDLTTDEWKRIIDRTAALDIKYLLFSGGEPTLRTDFIELLRYADGLSMITALRSNGTVLTQDMVGELASIKNLSSFCLSLDGATIETNDTLRGKGSFISVLDAAHLLKSAGIPTYLETTFSTANLSQGEHFVVIAKALGIEGLVVRQILSCGRAATKSADCGFNEGEVESFVALMREVGIKYGVKIHFTCVLNDPDICSRMVNVRYDGKVSYCYLRRESLVDSIFELDKETLTKEVKCGLR
jgi:MoaA/NifB/PqqE/SkfB family radical SAM enzyme